VLTASSQGVSERFVGRDKQVKQLLDLLAPSRADVGPAVVVSAVAGMGGIGKTALARHTGALAAGRGWFAGGAVFVDLRGYDLDQNQIQACQVFGPMLRVLGMPAEQIPASSDEQAAVYHQHLGQLANCGQRVLLVLDNASTTDQVRELLPHHQSHRAVVTTRDTLTLPSGQSIALDVLASDDAQQLLTQILIGRRPDDVRAQDPDGLARLVKMCGRLPLAVEITAAVLADEAALSIADLLGELEESEGPGAHRLRHGERTVADAFDRSLRRLQKRDPEAAALLPLLTLNPGPDFALVAAAALAGKSVGQVAPWLRVLRQASLLHQSAVGRWSIHDLVRLYAREHITHHTQQKATRRLLDHYHHMALAMDNQLRGLPQDVVLAAPGRRMQALEWFDTERANLTAAVTIALDTGDDKVTMGLATRLCEYLSLRRYLTDWVTVTGSALTAAQRSDDQNDVATAWGNRGLALRDVGRFGEALIALQIAAAVFRKIGARRNEVITLNNLGLALQDVGRFDDAILTHEGVAALYREIGDRRNEGIALNSLGAALLQVRRFADALIAAQSAATIFREIGDHRNEGIALNGIGCTLGHMKRFDEAIVAHENAIALYRETGDRYGEATALNNLGAALWEAKRMGEARTIGLLAVDAFVEVGDTYSAENLRALLDKLAP
jgi:tetratricopeptide (TPR) repeat protein